MLDLYSNADVTISATNSASVHAGFLQHTCKSGPRMIIRRECYSASSREDNSMILYTGSSYLTCHAIWTDQIERSLWNERTWTLQEALVFPRIIYFVREQLFFACASLGFYEEIYEGSDVPRPPKTVSSSTTHVYRSVSFQRP
jgi:hypothetical protein